MLTVYRGLQLQLKQLKIIFIFLCYGIESILYLHLTILQPKFLTVFRFFQPFLLLFMIKFRLIPLRFKFKHGIYLILRNVDSFFKFLEHNVISIRSFSKMQQTLLHLSYSKHAQRILNLSHFSCCANFVFVNIQISRTRKFPFPRATSACFKTVSTQVTVALSYMIKVLLLQLTIKTETVREMISEAAIVKSEGTCIAVHIH